MEASPLTQAHSHVAKAAQLTSSSNPQTSESLKEASTEHKLAADLFSQALETTNDVEARRTLELLRDHHRKLSQALGDASSLKSNPKGAAGSWSTSIIQTRATSPGPGAHGETPTLRRGGSSNSDTDASTQGFPPLPHHGQAPGMSNRLGKSTSSLLVSNLASKRGIPLAQSALTPLISPATTPGISTRRSGDSYQLGQHLNDVQPTTNPLLVLPPDKPMINLTKSQLRRNNSSTRDAAQPPEAGFNRFYTSLETFVSRIGSPLAGSLGFAGMDLGIDTKEQPKDSSPTNDGELIDGSTVPAHSDRDAYNYGYGVSEMVQNLMPKAWWSGQEQAVAKGGGKSKGIFGGGGAARGRGVGVWQGGNESFYVVPQSKSGQSAPASYAAIAGRSSTPPLDVTEDYSPLRPKKTEIHRRIRAADAGVGSTILETDETGADAENNSKTMEELILENQQLRHLTDTLSRRLHTWEVNARDSRAMLDRSLMLYRNKSGEGGSFGSTSGELRGSDKERELQKEANSLASKVAQLESEIDELARQLEREKKENERSTKKASYYKEKWDKLKEGARAKELRKQQQDGRGSMSMAGVFGTNMATPASGGSMGASSEA